MDLDLEQIRKLLELVDSSEITEFNIESGGEKITIKKEKQMVAALELPSMPRPQLQQVHHLAPAHVFPEPADEHPRVEEESNGKGLIPITSPMVGTFYRAPSPTAPPFIDIGDLVAPGQTVCIIEAMKLMNDLPAEVSGRIVKVCVESGTTVEYGQPLFMVNPKG